MSPCQNCDAKLILVVTGVLSVSERPCPRQRPPQDRPWRMPHSRPPPKPPKSSGQQRRKKHTDSFNVVDVDLQRKMTRCCSVRLFFNFGIFLIWLWISWPLVQTPNSPNRSIRRWLGFLILLVLGPPESVCEISVRIPNFFYLIRECRIHRCVGKWHPARVLLFINFLESHLTQNSCLH